jgi:hypothetical protein
VEVKQVFVDLDFARWSVLSSKGNDGTIKSLAVGMVVNYNVKSMGRFPNKLGPHSKATLRPWLAKYLSLTPQAIKKLSADDSRKLYNEYVKNHSLASLYPTELPQLTVVVKIVTATGASANMLQGKPVAMAVELQEVSENIYAPCIPIRWHLIRFQSSSKLDIVGVLIVTKIDALHPNATGMHDEDVVNVSIFYVHVPFTFNCCSTFIVVDY